MYACIIIIVAVIATVISNHFLSTTVFTYLWIKICILCLDLVPNFAPIVFTECAWDIATSGVIPLAAPHRLPITV